MTLDFKLSSIFISYQCMSVSSEQEYRICLWEVMLCNEAYIIILGLTIVISQQTGILKALTGCYMTDQSMKIFGCMIYYIVIHVTFNFSG